MWRMKQLTSTQPFSNNAITVADDIVEVYGVPRTPRIVTGSSQYRLTMQTMKCYGQDKNEGHLAT